MLHACIGPSSSISITWPCDLQADQLRPTILLCAIAYQHLFILLSAILFFFFAVAAGKDAYDQTPLPPPAVAEEASVKLHEEAARKLHEIGMPQHNRKAVKQLDSACVSPTRSTDKLADGDSEKGFPLA